MGEKQKGIGREEHKLSVPKVVKRREMWDRDGREKKT